MYYGGKGHMAKWIVSHLPKPVPGMVYVEPFAGAASVFWHLPQPYPVEVLNDRDEKIVALFRVLQDPVKFERLAHRLIWTPYALSEFRKALNLLASGALSEEDLAWAFFTIQNQGFSGAAKSEGQWSRALISNRDMAGTTNRWRGRLKSLQIWHDRLTRVQIDCRDALEVICYWDSLQTVFYCDPPYVPHTRVKGSREMYAHEYSESDHQALMETLLNVKGQVYLSGYASPLHEPLERAGWVRVDCETGCHAAGRVRGSRLRGPGAALRHARRTECLWMSKPHWPLLNP